MSFASKYSPATPLFNYAWGVWCTAWARYLLEQGIIIAGPEDFIYCDTDSVKYVDHGQSWEKFNEQARAASEASGACAQHFRILQELAETDRVRHE